MVKPQDDARGFQTKQSPKADNSLYNAPAMRLTTVQTASLINAVQVQCRVAVGHSQAHLYNPHEERQWHQTITYPTL